MVSHVNQKVYLMNAAKNAMTYSIKSLFLYYKCSYMLVNFSNNSNI